MQEWAYVSGLDKALSPVMIMNRVAEIGADLKNSIRCGFAVASEQYFALASKIKSSEVYASNAARSAYFDDLWSHDLWSHDLWSTL